MRNVMAVLAAVALGSTGACRAENLAVRTDCRVSADSTYAGYSAEVLNDGIEIVAGSDWILAGWASAENADDHYVELAWPTAHEIGEVVIYWCRDAGGFRASKRYLIQAREGDGWRTVAEGRNEEAAPFSAQRFDPVRTEAIRILQPSGAGPGGRSNLMWVAEVEAYRSRAEDGKGEGAERVTLELERGAYDVKFRTKAEGRARECGLELDAESIGAVYSRPLPWTEHHLVVETNKGSKLVIGGEGVQVAQAAAKPRKGPGGESMAPIAQLKDMHLQTPLADAVIAAPAGDEFQRLGEQVQAKVREVCGLELPIRPAAEVAKSEVESRTVIAIGNALDNPVVETLYNKGFVYADKVYPGEGGYAVRTVHNPLGAGFNVVTAAGSDLEGVRLAVERLCEHVEGAGGPTLPRILDIELGPPQSKPSPPAQDSIDARVAAYLRLRASGDAPEWALNNFASYGIRYNMTGDLAWAEMYRALMLALVGYWDEHGPWPMEWLWDPYWAWDNAEEAECFTDEERLKITNFLLDLGRTDRTRYAGAFTARNESSGGHQLDQNLCMFVLGDYFWKYYRHPEAREWLDAVAWRFQTSAKYHRLRHDSNDYNHAGYWFLLRHARISGDWTYVTNGQFARFVTYTQMMLDNLGYRAQNGDAGSPFAGPQPDMYSVASWLYKDGRHKWAIRNRSYTQAGNYANDLEPVKPEELVGVFRFDITEPAFYKYLTGHDADSELPPDVTPMEQAYDKISLRGDCDPRAEYMILDGMSRGEHGHDDGNSIIRYTDKGRIWLVDNDYIRRAPKWHNSAVVIKDGQAKLQPPLARADHAEDFGPVAMVRSTMPHYTGTDWERNIFWVKGDYFVFIDDFVAHEAGDYRLKMIWRTLGETSVQDGDFEVRQAGAADPFASCRPDEDSDADGIPDGFSASLSNKWGEVKTRTALDTEVFHSAPASVRMESDPNGYAVIWAFWPVTGGQKYRFHTMCKTDTTPNCNASTTIYWTGAGHQRLPQSVGGGPATGQTDWAPMDIGDVAPANAETAQVCIRISAQDSDTGQGTVWFDDLSLVQIAEDGAETAIFPTPPRPPSYSFFHIKNADGARLHVSSFLQRGHPRKDGYWVGYEYAGPEVKTLQQMQDQALEPGENHAFMNLLYTSDERQAASYELDYLSPTVAVVRGAQDAVVFGVRPAGVQEYEVGPLRVNADMFLVRGDALYAAGLKRVAIGDKEVFSSAEPVAQEVRLPVGDLVSRVRPPEETPRSTPPSFDQEKLDRRLEAQMAGAISSICRADVSGDGNDETVVGDAAGAVTVIAEGGEMLWQVQTGRAVNVVRAADVTGDGDVEVVAGGDDQKVHLYDSAGKELWAHEFEDFHGRDGKIVAMEIGDLAADGNMRIVVGTEAWHWYALDRDGNQLWRSSIPHAATVCALQDIDGDGDLEVVTGNEYYGWPVYDHLGKPIWRMSGGPGVLAVAISDLDGDGKLECLFGTGDGGASLRCMSDTGEQLWATSLGDEPRAIVCADLDGDGTQEVVASSDSMFLYAFKADGTPLWRIDAGDIVNVLAVYRGQIAAGSEDGTVHLIDATGEVVGRYPCGSAVKALRTTESDIIAGLASGEVLWLR